MNDTPRPSAAEERPSSILNVDLSPQQVARAIAKVRRRSSWRHWRIQPFHPDGPHLPCSTPPTRTTRHRGTVAIYKIGSLEQRTNRDCGGGEEE